MNHRITKIVSNVNAGPGRPRELEIGQYTILAGENGVGKTRWIHSVALGLTKAIDDYQGKRDPVTQTGALIPLIPDEDKGLHIELHFEGAKSEAPIIATYDFTVSKGTAHNAKANIPPALKINPEGAMPVREIAEKLRGSPASAAAFFLPYIDRTTKAEDIKRKIGKRFHDHENLSALPVSTTEISDHLERARQRILDAQGTQREGARFIDGAADLDADPTDDRIAEAQAAVDAAQSILAKSQSAGQLAAYAEATQRLAKIEAVSDQLGQPTPPDQAKLNLSDLIAKGAEVREMMQRFNLNLDPVTGIRIDLADPEVQARLQTLQTIKDSCDASLETYQKARTARAKVDQLLRDQQQTIKTIKTSMPDNLEGDETLCHRPEEAREALDAATAVLQGLLSTRARHEQVGTLRSAVAEAQANETWWKDYQAELTRVSEELIRESTKSFCAAVSAYLPPEYTFALITEEEGRKVFRIGLNSLEEGRTYYALSGGQLTVALFALTAEVLNRRPEGPPEYALFTPPEERGWGPKSLKRFMQAIAKSKFPYQILMPATVLPKGSGRLPKEWTVHDLDALSASLTAKEHTGADDDGANDDDDEDDENAEVSTEPAEAAEATEVPAEAEERETIGSQVELLTASASSPPPSSPMSDILAMIDNL